MNFVNFMVSLLAGTAIMSPTIVESPKLSVTPMKVAPPVVMVAKKVEPEVKEKVIKKEVVTPTGNCEEYREIINSYDWPVAYAMAICQQESQGNPNAEGDKKTPYHSYGLFQVRALPGRPSGEELIDPEFNIKIAYQIYKESGWCPWSVYKGPECD